MEDELKKVFVPVFACEERMKELEEQMKTAAETKETAPDGALLREYDRLQKQMEAMRGYSWRRDMETMFQRFGFDWRICGVRCGVFRRAQTKVRL